MPHSVQPGDPLYGEESDTRRELARVMGICDGCRRCTDLCGVFPRLIERLDSLADRDAGMMTPAMQDEVMDQCLHCGMCAVGCPYGPGGEEDLGVDMPRLAIRAQAVRRTGGHLPLRHRWADRVLGATDRHGSLAVRGAGVVNRVLGAPGESTVRKVVRAVSGLSATRLLPPVARERFTTIVRREGLRPEGRAGAARAVMDRDVTDPDVIVLPTCAVEYHEPEIGRDLLAVLAHNSVEAGVSAAVCCGAPWLHSGDLPRFATQARRVLSELGPAVARGATILVPQPSCAQVIRQEYPPHLAEPDARALAAAVRDPLEYLEVHGLITEFPGEVPGAIAYHAACPQRVLGVDAAEVRVLELLGAPVRTVARCSGTDGFWGLRAGNEQPALAMAQRLVAGLTQGDQDPAVTDPVVTDPVVTDPVVTDPVVTDPAVTDPAGEVMCGSCHLANTAVAELSGRHPQHPLRVLARAYGL